MKPGQQIHIDIFTEDTAKPAFNVIKNILKPIFKHIATGCQTQKITFHPPPEKQEARRKLSALHLWKAGKGIPAFAKELASLLLQGRYIFYQLDSDQPWNRTHQSDTLQKFVNLVLPSVWSILDKTNQAHLAGQQLFFLVPCRGIECWLFRHYKELSRLNKTRCQRLSGGAACQCEALVNHWIEHNAEPNHLLEGGPPSTEYPTPKDPMGNNDCPKKKLCFDSENGEISERFSDIFDDLYSLEFSFYSSVKFIEDSQPLKIYLASTQDDWQTT